MGKIYVGYNLLRHKSLCSRGSDHVHDDPSIWATSCRPVPSMACSSSLFYIEITLQQKVLVPAMRRFRCQPFTVILGCASALWWTGHIYGCRVSLVRERAKFEQILKFLEQDRGLVNWVTMPLIPVEIRWSYTHRHEMLSPDFIADEQCQKEASTAIFDPALAYERPTEGFAEDESAWERVRRENEA